MKLFVITIIIATTFVFSDDSKIKASANAHVEVKGKNSFKWKQAHQGLAKASSMFEKAKMQRQKAIEIKQKAEVKFKAIAETMRKAKEEQKKRALEIQKQYSQKLEAQRIEAQRIEAQKQIEYSQKLEAQRIEAQQQVEYSQKLETSSKTEIKKASKLKAYCNHLQGEYYYDNKFYKKAYHKFSTSKTISTHKEIHKTHYFMGKVHEKNKEYKKAKQCFEKSLKIKPSFKLATSALTNVKSLLGIDIGVDLNIFGG